MKGISVLCAAYFHFISGKYNSIDDIPQTMETEAGSAIFVGLEIRLWAFCIF